MNCWQGIKVGVVPTVRDCPSLPAGMHECWSWSCAKEPQAYTIWTHCQKAEVNTSVCEWEGERVRVRWRALPDRRFNFSTPFLCVSICLSAYLSLTLPALFLLQSNCRLKQIEKEYSQKLAKSTQVIIFFFQPFFHFIFLFFLKRTPWNVGDGRDEHTQTRCPWPLP